ncbi:hypothetical protein [Tepidibacter thalassicus]|uniref:BNR repeat-containing family member n=1 Tax=Tepidibacter thalassicus DSM 15285 TaxID=1123350 RepID=A0A1M5PEU7_9FIRM|nr:hypothetical protein [Tepidibacter thalassicus]SHH00296.1 hypothetical protein SAMN02744040_00445 [Tepidibacter thalassicus DSM 15285]
MVVDKNRCFIVKRYAKEMWFFFINNNSICYEVMNLDKIIENSKLIDNVKFYDVDLDEKGNIYLVCVNDKNEIWYFINSNNNWKKTILVKSYYKHDYIDCVNIFTVNNKVHIFYSIVNIQNTKYIGHYYFNGYKWIKNSLYSLKNIKSYFIDYSINGDVFFLFNKNDNNGLYLSVFSDYHKKWKDEIKLNIQNIDIIKFFVDSKCNIHLIYNDKGKIFTRILKNMQLDSKCMINENDQDINYKIFELDEMIWIVWKCENNMYCRYSVDYGVSWSDSKKIKSNLGSDVVFIENKEKMFKKIDTFGDLENRVVFGIDYIDEIYLKDISLFKKIIGFFKR